MMMQPVRILRGAEPFYLPGGRVGCLVIHGLTASPQEVYWLGKYLAERGATVLGPRLFGHGVSKAAIKRARWQDWYLSVLDGYHLLQQQCDPIFVLGLSLGGLLGLRLAAAEQTAGVVAMAAPLWLPISGAWRVPLLRRFGAVVRTIDQDADPLDRRIREMQRARGEPETGRVAYYEHSAAGIAELLRLQREIHCILGQIAVPVQLIYSEADTTVPVENAALVASKLTGSPEVRSARLTKSDHILTNDVEYMEVFEIAWSFVAQVAGAATPQK